jgi:hypothetical protein
MKYIQIILFSLTLFFAKANEDTIKINCYHEEVFENFCPTCVDTISYEVFTGITVERYDSTFRIYMPYKIYDEDTLTVIQDVYNNTVYVDLDSTAYSDKEDLANAIALCLGDTAVSTGTSGQDSIQWKDEYVDKGTKGGIKNVNFRGTNLTAADSLDWLNVTALIQQISITGTKGTIRLDNNGLYVVLGDSSSVNEGSLSFSVSANEGTIISNTLGSNTGYFNGRGILNLTDSSGHWLFTATESQTLSFSNPTLSISGGNSVNISAINTDNQYIDTFMIVGNYLKISVYGDNKRLDSVSLAAYLDNTDAQNLSYNSSTHAIDIVGGTSAVIPIASASPLTTGLITSDRNQNTHWSQPSADDSKLNRDLEWDWRTYHSHRQTIFRSDLVEINVYDPNNQGGSGPGPGPGASSNMTRFVGCMDPKNPSHLQNEPICFNLASPGNWLLKIYSKTGAEVKEFSGSDAAGVHQLTWNRKDDSGNLVASGIYNLVLQADRKALGKLAVFK